MYNVIPNLHRGTQNIMPEFLSLLLLLGNLVELECLDDRRLKYEGSVICKTFATLCF